MNVAALTMTTFVTILFIIFMLVITTLVSKTLEAATAQATNINRILNALPTGSIQILITIIVAVISYKIFSRIFK